jgi:hypothetical protein
LDKLFAGESSLWIFFPPDQVLDGSRNSLKFLFRLGAKIFSMTINFRSHNYDTPMDLFQ